MRPTSATGARGCGESRPHRDDAVLIASAPAAVGSRSPRPELAADRLRRPGVEIALIPITTTGDRDRTQPFGEIGERGVFVKELEEALLDGRIDVAVHSAKDMTSTDTAGLVVGAYPAARGSARRALRRERAPGRACASGRRRSAAGRSCSRSSRRCRSSRCAATSTRGCASAASAGSMRSCWPRAGSTGSGSAREIGHRFEPEELLPEAGQGALALQVRAGEEALVAAADDAETRRRVEVERALRGRDRRRLPRSGRRVSRRHAARGARRRRGRPLDRAPTRGRSRRRSRASSLAVPPP